MTLHWKIDTSKILTRREIALVLADLKRRARRSANSHQNLVIFRLATCCGLRASEITGLRIQDVRTGLARPYLFVGRAIAKCKKTRQVPLWWDRGTLNDLTAWKQRRRADGAQPTGYFVCAMSKRARGRRLSRVNVRHRFQVACRILGDEHRFIGEEIYGETARKKGQPYRKQLTLHHGRHSFCSHALAGGRSLAEVRDAAGHADISTTSVYIHVVGRDEEPGNLFDF
jgi:site-specific recombinase XerD